MTFDPTYRPNNDTRWELISARQELSLLKRERKHLVKLKLQRELTEWEQHRCEEVVEEMGQVLEHVVSLTRSLHQGQELPSSAA